MPTDDFRNRIGGPIYDVVDNPREIPEYTPKDAPVLIDWDEIPDSGAPCSPPDEGSLVGFDIPPMSEFVIPVIRSGTATHLQIIDATREPPVVLAEWPINTEGG